MHRGLPRSSRSLPRRRSSCPQIRGCRGATAAAASRACIPSSCRECWPKCRYCPVRIPMHAGESHVIDDAPRNDVARAAWVVLGGIVDPEIPVVSIVELGIVRDVACSDDECVVTLTPTYSGCPATRAIEADARSAVAGVTGLPLRIVNALAPPWSSDWIAPEARRKLAALGIAPPRPASTGTSPIVVAAC